MPQPFARPFPGKKLRESALNKAVLDIERRLFCVGGIASVVALVDRILQRPLVRQVFLVANSFIYCIENAAY